MGIDNKGNARIKPKRNAVEKIRLGKTDMMVTRLGFGGIPIQRLNDDDAVKVVSRCLDLGINFLDTANGYTTSEERIGQAVKGRRQDVFIASEPADELLPLCRENDVGFINMKPMAGGMLSNAAVAFKYLFQFPDIAIIPGIEKVGEIEEIVRIYNGSHRMTAAEQKQMQQLKDELGTRFCRRCDYCQPCPQEIPISMALSFPSFVKRLPPDWYLKSPFIPGAMAKAAECTECGECETRCPYQLPIREMVAEAYKLFEEIKAGHQSQAS